jgi:hypothetical protein
LGENLQLEGNLLLGDNPQPCVKTISINIEVVDVSLDYNLLLGHSRFYAMIIVSSLVFRLLQFPHQGKILTIDQLDY